jgi:hypothetical protein
MNDYKVQVRVFGVGVGVAGTVTATFLGTLEGIEKLWLMRISLYIYNLHLKYAHLTLLSGGPG